MRRVPFTQGALLLVLSFGALVWTQEHRVVSLPEGNVVPLMRYSVQEKLVFAQWKLLLLVAEIPGIGEDRAGEKGPPM